MVTKPLAQIVEEQKAKAKINEGFFIPQSGEKYQVYIFDEDPEIDSRENYTFVSFKCRYPADKTTGKVKQFRIFDNQTVEMAEALAKHPDRIIIVEKLKDGKKTKFY